MKKFCDASIAIKGSRTKRREIEQLRGRISAALSKLCYESNDRFCDVSCMSCNIFNDLREIVEDFEYLSEAE
jgi:hypothetical protein